MGQKKKIQKRPVRWREKRALRGDVLYLHSNYGRFSAGMFAGFRLTAETQPQTSPILRCCIVFALAMHQWLATVPGYTVESFTPVVRNRTEHVKLVEQKKHIRKNVSKDGKSKANIESWKPVP